ncbi:hypothetical protein WME75_32150 [Sorangium sp. So ce1014]|uniref:hypothetical protein n=1 Tax=Sorangium sp. So ce1014 TaxID=3133326 RepID=UPI003F5E1516
MTAARYEKFYRGSCARGVTGALVKGLASLSAAVTVLGMASAAQATRPLRMVRGSRG